MRWASIPTAADARAQLNAPRRPRRSSQRFLPYANRRGGRRADAARHTQAHVSVALAAGRGLPLALSRGTGWRSSAPPPSADAEHRCGAGGGIVQPDVLKLDVHGVEPEILRSLSDAQVETLVAVHVELLSSAPTSGSRPPSPTTDPLLRAKGFELFHLQRHSVRRKEFERLALLEPRPTRVLDALYLRPTATFAALLCGDTLRPSRCRARRARRGGRGPECRHRPFARGATRSPRALRRHPPHLDRRARPPLVWSDRRLVGARTARTIPCEARRRHRSRDARARSRRRRLDLPGIARATNYENRAHADGHAAAVRRELQRGDARRCAPS